MNTRTRVVEQWTAKQDRDNLSLIPPLAEEFRLNAASATASAKKWALGNRFLLADGIPPCAHGLYLLSMCAGLGCRGVCPQLDHARIWVPYTPGDDGRPFLLSHSYTTEITQETRSYAAAHGLQVASYPQFGDDWYGFGTLPIRMSLPSSWPVWPIEEKAAILLSTQPVKWPEDDE